MFVHLCTNVQMHSCGNCVLVMLGLCCKQFLSRALGIRVACNTSMQALGHC